MASSGPKAPGTPTARKTTVPPAKANEGLAREGEPDTASDAEAAPPALNQIRYPCLTNMDYHAAREGWLDQLHRWLMFAVIIAGAAAFSDIWEPMRVVGPVIAVLAGALDLTFDLSNRARTHAMFRRQYADILAAATREPEKLGVLQCKLDELNGEEEPPFTAQLCLSAMRAQQQTYGEVRDPCRPGLYYRLQKNFRRFSGHDFNEH